MNPVLDIRELSVIFSTDEGPVRAVERLNLALQPAEVLAVVGESGCGKSVTAMSVLGIEPPSATVTGEVMLGGRDLRQLSRRALRSVRGNEIGMVFQEPMTSLNPAFTVGRQLTETLRCHRRYSQRAARSRAVELLELVGMPAPARRIAEYPHQLSGGMRQRVMIAMAIACEPAVLLADEPTTALDVTIQAQVLEILRDLRRELGTAVVLITHNLGVVADIADRVMVMYAGHAVEEGTTDALFAHPQHPYTAGLLAAVPQRGQSSQQPLAEIPGTVPVLRASPAECVFAPRCPRVQQDCHEGMPQLRQVNTPTAVACLHPGARAQQEAS